MNCGKARKNCISNWYDPLSSFKSCIENFQKSYANKIDCAEYCPLECDSFEFSFKTYAENIFKSSGNISQKTKEKYRLLNFTTYEEVKKHFFSFHVYYTTIGYTAVSEQPKSELFNLIASIGGILGLCFGASFLTLVEVIEMLLEIFLISIKK